VLRLLAAVGGWAPCSAAIAAALAQQPVVAALGFCFWQPPPPPPPTAEELAAAAAAAEAAAAAAAAAAADPKAKGKAAPAPAAAAPAAAAPAAEPPLLQLPPFGRDVRDAAIGALAVLCGHPPFATALLEDEAALAAVLADLPACSLPEGPAVLAHLAAAAGAEGARAKGVLAALGAAAAAVQDSGTPFQRTALGRALVVLPLGSYVVPARPPPLTPPRTPEPPPLATTQFVWDALERPVITDGSLLNPV